MSKDRGLALLKNTIYERALERIIEDTTVDAVEVAKVALKDTKVLETCLGVLFDDNLPAGEYTRSCDMVFHFLFV